MMNPKKPAEEECGGGAEGLAEIDVLPARLGIHGPEFGERERAAQGDQAASQPDRQEQAGGGESGGDDPGRHIDARADDGPYDKERRVQEAEPPEEPGLRAGSWAMAVERTLYAKIARRPTRTLFP